MNNKDLFQAFSQTDEQFLDKAEKMPKKKKKNTTVIKFLAAAAGICLVVSALMGPLGDSKDTTEMPPDELVGALPSEGNMTSDPLKGSTPDKESTYHYQAPSGSTGPIATALQPDVVPFPNLNDYSMESDESSDAYYTQMDLWENQWKSSRLGQQEDSSIPSFLFQSASEFLTNTTEENAVYSPLNVYFALSMLAETAEGNSRQQILDALHCETIEELRLRTNSLWNASYRNDGYVTSLLANSLWMDNTLSYCRNTLTTLANQHHASVFSGKMGSAEYNTLLQNWLNENTKNMLTDQISSINMTNDTRLSLASTIYFSANWNNKFVPEATVSKAFHSPTGDVTCEFMQQRVFTNGYFGEHFTAANKELDYSGDVWFILPDNGYTPADILADEEFYDFLEQGPSWENKKFCQVHMMVPKFDVSSQLDLRDGMEGLGITDVFDASLSNFFGITNEKNVFLSKALHGARVTLNEQGCEAAAYTVMMMDGAPFTEESLSLILDRPFIFMITNEDGLPLFIGVVNQP